MKKRTIIYPKTTSSPKRREDELPVYGNLTTTPSQMLHMAERGIPISAQNLGFRPEDGENNPSWEIPLDRMRGVDPAEMWEQSQVIKARAKRAHDRDRLRFGDGEYKPKEK